MRSPSALRNAVAPGEAADPPGGAGPNPAFKYCASLFSCGMAERSADRMEQARRDLAMAGIPGSLSGPVL